MLNLQFCNFFLINFKFMRRLYIKNAELYFIEFEQETWDKNLIFIVKETRQYQKCN